MKNLEVIEEVLADNISIFSGKNRQVGGADLVCTNNPKIMSFEVFGGRPHFSNWLRCPKMAIIDPRNLKLAILETNNRITHIFRTFEKLWKMTIFEFWVQFWHQKCQKVKILQIILVKISHLVPKVLSDFFLIFRHPPSTSLNLLLVLRGFSPFDHPPPGY